MKEIMIRPLPKGPEITPDMRAKWVEITLKEILEAQDESDAKALARARAEKDSFQKQIMGLKDKLRVAKTMIMQHQDSPAGIKKEVYGEWKDVRYTFGKFMSEFFGTALTTFTVQSFFGSQRVFPTFESIRVGPNEDDTVEVPERCHWEMPLSEGYIIQGELDKEEVDLWQDESEPGKGYMSIKTTKRRRLFWDRMLQVFEQYKQDNSLFKGKVVSSVFEFLPFANVTWDDVILRPEAQECVDIHLRAPIRQRKRLADNGIPFRRGVLLAGKYGVGKTMLAKALANECTTNEVTFIVVHQEDMHKFADVLSLARQYAPAVVFVEDIDTLVPHDRTNQADAVLNALDGLRKLGDVMVVFTTNHQNRISQALQRPGRIDEVIHVGAADGPSRIKLLMKTINDKGLSHGDLDQESIIAATVNYPGSFLVEVVQGAVMRNVSRTGSGRISLETEDLIWGANRLQSRVKEYVGYDPSQHSSADGAVALLNKLAAITQVPSADSSISTTPSVVS